MNNQPKDETLDCEALRIYKAAIDKNNSPEVAEQIALQTMEARMSSPSYKIKKIILDHAFKIIITLLTIKGGAITLWLQGHL